MGAGPERADGNEDDNDEDEADEDADLARVSAAGGNAATCVCIECARRKAGRCVTKSDDTSYSGCGTDDDEDAAMCASDSPNKKTAR